MAHKPVTEGARDVSRKSNLIQRNGRWSFNKAYPKELWPVVGRAPFRLALNTDSLEQAQRLRGFAEQRYWAAVDDARRRLGEVVARPLTSIEATAIVSRWFLQRNEELDHSHLHAPTPHVILDVVREELTYSERELSRRLGDLLNGFCQLDGRIAAAIGVTAIASALPSASRQRLADIAAAQSCGAETILEVMPEGVQT